LSNTEILTETETREKNALDAFTGDWGERRSTNYGSARKRRPHSVKPLPSRWCVLSHLLLW